MNAAAGTQPDHFVYFPGNYRWSAGMLGALSSAPYGGSDITEIDRASAASCAIGKVMMKPGFRHGAKRAMCCARVPMPRRHAAIV